MTPPAAARFHKWAAVAWSVFAVPTVIWWRDSIVLVLLISIYANVVGHWSAYEAARPTPSLNSEED